ncbi:MAG: 50S ribosomal protein L11 methyltransferase [Candidatus Kryptonium sp.]
MSHQTWIEISILDLPEDIKDEIIYLANELGSVGCWEDENLLKCYFKKENWGEKQKNQLLNFIQNLHGENARIKISIEEISDKDWNKIWEQTIEPIEVGEKFVIKPTWKQYHKPNKIIIQIDPKMAFGTGHHETTRLMLRAIEKYLYPKCKVLDVGTGSGILSIAAIKLGAEISIGVDNDHWAYENAIENAEINNVKDKFKIILGTVDDVSETNFDFVLANINKNAIIKMLPKFYDKLKERGILITSGYLDIDQGTIEEHLWIYNLEIIDVLKENEWIAIVSKK